MIGKIWRASLILVLCAASTTAWAEVFRLNELVSVQSVKLRSIKDRYKISIPIPNRWKVTKATLKFSFVNSSALIARRSQLVVSMDDIPLYQSELRPLEVRKVAEVNIPGRMLKPGYHELAFEVAQHSEKECEDPFAPELWTVLELGDATLSVDFSLRPIPSKLSAVTEFVEDPKIFPHQNINLVMERMDPRMLEVAAAVAGGIGARLSYRPVHLSVSTSLAPGMDNIYIGTDEGLKRLGVSRGTAISGPKLTIGPLPTSPDDTNSSARIGNDSDNTHVLVTISGKDIQETRKAALAFSSVSFPFPPHGEMAVKSVRFPKVPPYHRKALLTPGIPAEFRDFAFSTHVFQGMNKEPVSMEFHLPPDLYIKPNQYAVLSLHFGFGAGLRRDSTMKIILNGKPVYSVHMDDEHGAFFENYKILLPTYLFRPGKNVLTFQPVLVPLIIKRCEGFQDMNLFLTLFEDSKIMFPEMGHLGTMPQIRYFFDSGFPFARDVSGAQAAFLLTSMDIPSITLALNIAAYIGQMNGIAPVDMEFAKGVDDVRDKELILIGPAGTIPGTFMRQAPLVLEGSSAIVDYPQFVDLSQADKRTFWQRWEERLENLSKLFPVEGVTVESKVSADRIRLDSESGIIMEFQSPVSAGRTVLLWTSGNSSVFSASVPLLWSGRLRNTAQGDLVVYSAEEEGEVHSLKIGPDYYVGRLEVAEKIDFLFRSYPWLFYMALGVSFTVLAIIFGAYLRWRRKKRLANEI